MKRQDGQVLPLVLVFLLVGTLLISPLLNYVFTGLRSQQIFENIVSRNYAADAAVEDVLRQMLDSIQDGGTPAETYEVEFGMGKWGVATVIEIPYIPPSELLDDFADPKLDGVMVEVWPTYLEATEADSVFYYIVRLALLSTNYVGTYGWTLPQNVEYVSNSTYLIFDKKNNLYTTDPVRDATHPIDNHQVKKKNITWTNMNHIADPVISPDLEYPDRQALEWTLPIGVTYVGTVITVCKVSGTPPGGVCYIEPWLDTPAGTVQLEPCAGLGYGFYVITLDVQGISYEVIVSYDSTPPGSWNIVSYNVVE